jgi:DNA excision repair protein ERCC-4
MRERVVLVCDTREIEPFAFPPERVATVRRALPAGDYSVEGMEQRVAVERKTLDDLVRTVIRERDRFRRELALLSNYEAACVVVEAQLSDVLASRYRAGAHPRSVLGAVISITIDYGVPVFFCGDRPYARQFTEAYLLRFHRKSQP